MPVIPALRKWRQEDQGHHQLHSKLGTHLSYIKPCLKRKKKNRKEKRAQKWDRAREQIPIQISKSIQNLPSRRNLSYMPLVQQLSLLLPRTLQIRHTCHNREMAGGRNQKFKESQKVTLTCVCTFLGSCRNLSCFIGPTSLLGPWSCCLLYPP